MYPDAHIGGRGETKPQTHLEGISVRLAKLLEQARDTDGRLAAINARAYGAVPGQEVKATPESVPNGAVQTIERYLDELDEVMRGLDARTLQLNALV